MHPSFRKALRAGLAASVTVGAALSLLLITPGTADAAGLSCDSTSVAVNQINARTGGFTGQGLNSGWPGVVMGISLSRNPDIAYVSHTGVVKPNSTATWTYFHEDGYVVYGHGAKAEGNGVIRHEPQVVKVSDIGFANERLEVKVAFETNSCGWVGGATIGWLRIFP